LGAQRFQDQSTLPNKVRSVPPMLQSATAAITEMTTDRPDPVDARPLDREEFRRRGIEIDQDFLIRERKRQKNGAVETISHPVAAHSQVGDGQSIHAWRRSGIRGYHRPLRSARA